MRFSRGEGGCQLLGPPMRGGGIGTHRGRGGGVNLATLPSPGRGEENLDLLEALRRSTIKLVLTRHEQAAAFMAATHGRLTGRPTRTWWAAVPEGRRAFGGWFWALPGDQMPFKTRGHPSGVRPEAPRQADNQTSAGSSNSMCCLGVTVQGVRQVCGSAWTQHQLCVKTAAPSGRAAK